MDKQHLHDCIDVFTVNKKGDFIVSTIHYNDKDNPKRITKMIIKRNGKAHEIFYKNLIENCVKSIEGGLVVLC